MYLIVSMRLTILLLTCIGNLTRSQLIDVEFPPCALLCVVLLSAEALILGGGLQRRPSPLWLRYVFHGGPSPCSRPYSPTLLFIQATTWAHLTTQHSAVNFHT